MFVLEDYTYLNPVSAFFSKLLSGAHLYAQLPFTHHGDVILSGDRGVNLCHIPALERNTPQSGRRDVPLRVQEGGHVDHIVLDVGDEDLVSELDVAEVKFELL